MNVGLVGLVVMGVAIAERVLAADYPLTVYNRTLAKTETVAAAGAAVAHDPGSLLATNDVCLSVVADDVALEMVTSGPRGILSKAAPGSILVDMSTVSPDASARIAEAAERASVGYLRAPVSGNPAVARAGKLTIIASGPRPIFERALPLLEAIGPTVRYVGDAEQARVVKLALQILIGGTAELLAEALVLAEAGDVERAVLLETLGESAVGSPFVKYKTPALLADDYSVTFTTLMMLKDVDLVLAAADSRGVQAPLTAALRELLRAAIEAGHGEADFMALYPALRDSG